MSELSDLYRKVAVYEILEKLKNCGVAWTQLSTVQYVAEVEQSGYDWVIYITKNISVNKVILDFRRDSNYFFSIDSDQEQTLFDLFYEVEGDYEFDRDKEILNNLVNLPSGCYHVYDEIMSGGIKLNSVALVLVQADVVSAGVILGSSVPVYVLRRFTASRGIKIGGTFGISIA